MYLHQQLIDNLILQSKQGVRKLYSKYINDINDDDFITEHWYKFSLKPNTISKLRYQSQYKLYDEDNNGYCLYYNYYHHCECYECMETNIMARFHWNYLLGPINFNQYTMEYALVNFRLDIDIVNFFIKIGIKPNQEILNMSAHHNNIEIFNICVDNDVIPNKDTMDMSVHNSNTEIFKVCLRYVIPDNYTLLIAKIWPNNHDIIDLLKIELNK